MGGQSVVSSSSSEDNSNVAIGGKTYTAWQMEVLMEKLRSKAGGLKSLPEAAKMVKQAVMVRIVLIKKLILSLIYYIFIFIFRFLDTNTLANITFFWSVNHGV